MSVKIRLSKVGRKHQISFRIIACEARTKRDGAFLEILGFYNPGDGRLKLKEDRISYWIGKGAKPTEAVTKILNQKSNIKDQNDISKFKMKG